MRRRDHHRSRRTWLAFSVTLAIFMALGAAYGLATPATAAPSSDPEPQIVMGYAGPDACGSCHTELHTEWEVSRHARAFSSPIFQQNWEELGSQFSCLACHTTGYDPDLHTYAFQGVTCESCHGAFQSGHPTEPMPITPDAELCSTCHETSTNEWKASVHGQTGIQCQSCHDPHAQMPKAESVTALCSNCHKDTGTSFSHGTHAGQKLECSNCHMYTSPRDSDPIEGLVPTGHTFSVGSEACIGCHQDSVHTRDTILELTGEVTELSDVDPDDLRQKVLEQEETISDLESKNSVRLYIGLAQGALVGLATGAVAAWVVSRRIEFIEDEGDEDE